MNYKELKNLMTLDLTFDESIDSQGMKELKDFKQLTSLKIGGWCGNDGAFLEL